MKNYIAGKYEKLMSNDDDLKNVIGQRAKEGKINKLYQLKSIMIKPDRSSFRWDSKRVTNKFQTTI